MRLLTPEGKADCPEFFRLQMDEGAGGALGKLLVPSWFMSYPRCEKKTMWHCFKHYRKRASVVLLAPLRLLEIRALGYLLHITLPREPWFSNIFGSISDTRVQLGHLTQIRYCLHLDCV